MGGGTERFPPPSYNLRKTAIKYTVYMQINKWDDQIVFFGYLALEAIKIRGEKNDSGLTMGKKPTNSLDSISERVWILN